MQCVCFYVSYAEMKENVPLVEHFLGLPVLSWCSTVEFHQWNSCPTFPREWDTNASVEQETIRACDSWAVSPALAVVKNEAPESKSDGEKGSGRLITLGPEQAVVEAYARGRLG